MHADLAAVGPTPVGHVVETRASTGISGHASPMKRVSRPSALTATFATAALVGASLIVPGAAQAATTETFVDGTGGVVADIPFDWTVPAGVTSIEVVADGAGGGGGYYYPGSPLDSVGTGGSGARVTATLTVTPGQVLVLTVGGPGVGGDITASAGGAGGSASSVCGVCRCR